MQRSIRVGLIGLGTVGSGVVHILRRHAKRLQHEVGRPIELKGAAVRDLSKPREPEVPSHLLTDDALALARRSDIDIVVEVMGGVDEAKAYALEALQQGKRLVTANKAIIALKGQELFDAAQKNGVGIYFEASVAGGIPIIKALRESLAANRIESVYGILNGTCNYILTQMSNNGQPYETALKKAQELGYAEADPTFDVDGHDTAHKIAILSSLAYGYRVDAQHVQFEGIRGIQPQDLECAREMGYTVKLLGISRRLDDGVSVQAHPTMIPETSVLANVQDAYNAVAVVGDAVGPALFLGLGAGKLPTASAVVADLLDAARDLAANAPAEIPLCWRGDVPPSADSETEAQKALKSACSRRYIRLEAEDRPGVLAEIAAALGRHGVSIAAVSQKESTPMSEGTVPLILLTHLAAERGLRAALHEINDLPCVRQPGVSIRVETEL